MESPTQDKRLEPEMIKKLKKHLEDYPIDPQYDEECMTLDGNPPKGQGLSRIAKEILDKHDIV